MHISHILKFLNYMNYTNMLLQISRRLKRLRQPDALTENFIIIITTTTFIIVRLLHRTLWTLSLNYATVFVSYLLINADTASYSRIFQSLNLFVWKSCES
jgi:hypothetical protein